MRLAEGAIDLERQVREGKALKLAGELVEELRMLNVLHEGANKLAGRIRHYVNR